MSVAGYPSQNVPRDHVYNQLDEAACYRVIDYVYSHSQSPDTANDDNGTRMHRLNEAEKYIKKYEPSLWIIFFTEK